MGLWEVVALLSEASKYPRMRWHRSYVNSTSVLETLQTTVTAMATDFELQFCDKRSSRRSRMERRDPSSQGSVPNQICLDHYHGGVQ